MTSRQVSTRNALESLARLLEQRSLIDAEISLLIGRPAHSGHLGEFIASQIFDIRLHGSATTKLSDGIFASGPLEGRSVNVKHYTWMEGLLDVPASIDPADHPDFYLVMAGPRVSVGTSRGQVLKFAIAGVYLFDARELVAEQLRRSVKLGIASSVPSRMWSAAMIYPDQNNPLLPVSENQRSMLARFGARAAAA